MAAAEFSVTTEEDEAADADGVDLAEYDQGLDICNRTWEIVAWEAILGSKFKAI